MRRTVARAGEMGAIPTVMSFDVHPDTLVRGTEVPLINSAHGREELIRRLFGIESVVFIHFDRAVMQMPWQMLRKNSRAREGFSSAHPEQSRWCVS